MKEDEFRNFLRDELSAKLPRDYKIESDANLYYNLTINNRLEVDQDPKNPKGGTEAFQVGILISRLVREVLIPRELSIPKIVIEIKDGISAHDLITYSYRALKHKEVYPYIRYGLIICNEESIPNRFFIHNQGIDFALAVADEVDDSLVTEIKRQILFADKLENNIFGDEETNFYSTDPNFKKHS